MNKHDEKWLSNYKSFKEYVEVYSKIPDKDVKSTIGSNLLGWFKTQRHNFNNCSITSNKVDLLSMIVPNILENLLRRLI